MSGTVCVTGASGFIGSWLVLRLLEKGHTVRATVRDPKDEEKVKHLMEFPNAEKQLTLWKADLADEGSYVEPINGCIGVFHVATPMDYRPNDPEIVWEPYLHHMISLPDFCIDSRDVWPSICPLICFHIVEWHRPDRVMRQFGLRQDIPSPCDTDLRLHTFDLRGRKDADWRIEHAPLIARWSNRRSHIIDGDPVQFPGDCEADYVEWYTSITRLFITRHAAAFDFVKEVINPAINGMLGIMKACMDSKTVRRLIFTSSAATVNIEENQKPEYDETCWSDTEFILSRKMPEWVYLLSKTLAEKAAGKFAEENKIDLITIIPTLVIGSYISSSMPLGLYIGLSLLTGNEANYSVIKQCQYIHVDDLCKAHIFLFEHPDAKGRYICSSNDATIYDIANLLRQKYSHHYNVPSKFNGIEEDLKTVRFSSKKLEELGFQFKYSLEDMYADAIESCQSKGLLTIGQSQS